MPYREPDPSDPSMLVGVAVSGSEEELREMAAAFAGELAQIGHDAPAILRLFRDPCHAGAHLAWRVLGAEEVRRIVEEAVEFFSHCHVVVQDTGRPQP